MNIDDVDLESDLLFVGATRPAMRWGVTYAALLVNLVLTMESFLLTKNLLTLLLALPIHALCVLLCGREPRYFELLMLWMRTKGLAWVANARFWKASSYSPLPLCTRNRRCRRVGPTVRI